MLIQSHFSDMNQDDSGGHVMSDVALRDHGADLNALNASDPMDGKLVHMSKSSGG
jgi:hypothetical protein